MSPPLLSLSEIGALYLDTVPCLRNVYVYHVQGFESLKVLKRTAAMANMYKSDLSVLERGAEKNR
jgi:hypothetical protein